MLQVIGPVFFNVLAPILALVGLGAALRWKFAIDLQTLSKINIYLLVPAFVFDNVSTSTLSWEQMAGVCTITIVQMVTLALLVCAIGWGFGAGRSTLAAVVLAVIFYNSGNYGLPLAELAFPGRDAPGAGGGAGVMKDGGAVQAFVMMTQNVLSYTLGMVIAALAGSKHPPGRAILRVFRLPVLPTLAAALAARWWLRSDPSHELPIAISKTASYLAGGLVPMALITLGVQLAVNPRWPRWRPVSLVMVLRLLLGPIQMAAILWVFHMMRVPVLDLWGTSGWPAELLILTAGVPTAVVTLLLTLELQGDAELAADCVFWTTIGSCFTIAGWLVGLRWFFGS